MEKSEDEKADSYEHKELDSAGFQSAQNPQTWNPEKEGKKIQGLSLHASIEARALMTLRESGQGMTDKVLLQGESSDDEEKSKNNSSPGE